MRNRIAVAGLTLALAACGSGDRETVEDQDGSSAEISTSGSDGTQTTTIEAEGGTATIRSGPATSAELPLGFKLYPGAEVLESATFNQNGDNGALLRFISDAKPDELVAFYRKAAEDAGITVDKELLTDKSQIIGGKAAGGVAFSFSTVPGSDGKTQGQLMIGSGG
ncbi:hypothetical protein [Parerythrobacter lacustris]|uniref:Uncharacterized protein n=1 Tax=Parerythrobacter lacustris TaxID=2969984 RepID=A0ABT1XPT5_9SPHN|nr:hypothetical protein [Parerythrobacter lacustris]MCR2833264.1 hypothetical protein [Parerythrobacter lacustris]